MSDSDARQDHSRTGHHLPGHGFQGDASRFLSKSPAWIASGLQQLKVDHTTISIVSSWGDTLSDEEVLSMLKDINDKGSI